MLSLVGGCVASPASLFETERPPALPASVGEGEPGATAPGSHEHSPQIATSPPVEPPPPDVATSRDAHEDVPAAPEPDVSVPAAPAAAPAPPERAVPPLAPPYIVLAGVDLSDQVEDKLASIAARYFARTGKRLVCTSGTRDPEHQAAAVYELLRLGADVMRLYRNKDAARELVHLFLSGRASGRTAAAVTADLATAIRRQMERGVFLSAHLAERAVDVRSRDMSPADRRAFVEEVSRVGGVRLLEERVPPHFHLQLD